MTVRYLIDTDWVIPYLNGRDDIVLNIASIFRLPMFPRPA